MASYGKIYEFVRDSQNGAEIIITISKKNYTGESMVRPLGRAPMLKRENNGHIFGTSLEIYAECKVDGEFAQFYTSSADEFLVEVWKDQVLIWSGFISPELYSEPDIAPPYDVQIIATDGLGELKNFEYVNDGDVSISEHLSQLISHTGLSLEAVMASDLRYYGGEVASDAVDILDFRVDLSHDDGESCYDVLQNLLSSLNASITQFNGKWFIFRETDFIGLTSADGLKAFTPGGSETFMDIAFFGSAKTCQWWPVGQLSSVIEPAKNRLTLISPNNYKNNVLDGSWTSANGAVYDEAESAYVLPDEGSYITQKLDFAGEEVGYRLALRVTARNVGSGEEDQALGVRVLIDGRSYAGERQYWLVQPASSDRGIGSYMWKTSEGSVEADLAVPSDSDTSADAQDIDIILPLYRNNNRSYIYAKTVEVTVFNPAGIHDIYVYGVSLSKYDQFEGYQANVVLDNGAREEGSSIDLSLSDGATAPAAGNVFMSGIPLQPDTDEAIISWGIGSSDAEDYIGLMSKDYSRKVALPRMSYKGVLNVPRAAIPALFLRDNTYYFPRTYTYDLYNDELEVDLISIPAADLSIESIQIGQIAQPQGVPSSGGSGGGGGIGGVDLSGYAKKEEVTTLAELLTSMWTLDEDGNLVTDRNVRIAKNVIIGGDMSSAAKGRDAGTAGGIIGVKVGDAEYTDITAGILDMTDAFKDLDVDLSDYYTSDETDAKIAESLIPYAKIADIGSTYATKASLETLQGEVDNIEAILGMDEEAEGIINTWNEVKAFLDGYSSSDDLAAILSTMNADIAKRALDSDLDTLAGRVGVNELAIADNAGNIKKNFDAIGTLESNKADKATTLAGYGITDAYTKVNVDNLLKKYLLLEAESQTIKGNLKIEGNLIIAGDMSSEGTGGNSGADGTVIGVVVNGTQYADETNGMLDLSTLMNQYATTEWINGKKFATISDLSSAIGPLSGRVATLESAGFITSAALANYLPKSGGTINGTTTSPLKINTTATDENGINFLMSGASKAWVGYSQSAGAYIYENSSGQYLCVKNGTPYYGTASSLKTIIHSGNIGSQFVEGIATAYANQSINFGREGKVRMIYCTIDNATSLGYPRAYTSGLSVVTSYTGWQMVTHGGSLLPNPFFRKLVDDGTWSDWKQLAFTDSNVASATKLATARTIWGQSFDGTDKVDGVLAINGLDILYSNGSSTAYFGNEAVNSYVSGNNVYLRYGANTTTGLTLNSSGNVTIGASDLAGTTYKMSVDGKVHIRSTAGAAMTEGAGSLIVGNGAVLMIDANDIQAKANGTIAGPLYINDWGGNVILCGKNNGNVGIGTASPAEKYKLDVAGDIRSIASSAATRQLVAENTNASLGVGVNASGESFIYTAQSKPIKFYTSGTERMRIAADGAVTMSSTLIVTSSISIGSNSGAALYLARNSANYIWSSVSGGYMVFGCADRGVTNTTNASLLVHSYYVSPGYSNRIVDLGHQNYRWKKLHCVDADFSGAVTMASTLSVGGNISPKTNNDLHIGTYASASFGFINANVHSSGAAANNLWLVAGSSTDAVGIQFARNNNGTSTGKIGTWDATGLYPAINNSFTLGTSSYQWSAVYAVKALIGTATDSGEKLQIHTSAWDGGLAINRTVSGGGASIAIYSNGTKIGCFGIDGSKWFEIANTSDTRFWVDTATGKTTIGQTSLQTSYMLYANGNSYINGTLGVSGAVTMSSTLTVSQKLQCNGPIFGYMYGSNKNAAAFIFDKPGSNYTGIGSDVTANTIRLSACDDAGTWVNYTQNWKFYGNIIMTGDMSSTSDMRLKHRIDDVVFDLKTIAEMPLFTFRWKDGRDDRLHLGSSAQYWEKPAPWLVMGDETKTLNYAVLGVAGVKALAVTAVDHETRLKMLERKVNELETENMRLRYGN